jgi:N-ethylmaleimide reductase
VLEVVDAIVARIGAARAAIRLSPHSTIFDMPAYPEADGTYRYLAQALGRRDLAYLHLHDVGPMMSEGDALISEDLLLDIKTRFGGPTILAGGMNKERATDLIERGLIDLAAFGQPYIGNPDLVERLRDNHPLTTPDRDTYYGGGAEGYVDYARVDETSVSASPA